MFDNGDTLFQTKTKQETDNLACTPLTHFLNVITTQKHFPMIT